MALKSVWIAEDCTVCRECEQIAPDIFHVDDDAGTCLILREAREDNLTSTNEAEKSPLKADIASLNEEEIRDAAEACPVEIIHLIE